MNAGCADLFPQISDRIEADELRAMGDIEQQGIDDFKQYFGVAIVEIDLIGTESRPDFPFTQRSADFSQQRQRARSNDLREIGIVFNYYEVIAIPGIILQELLEPVTFRRDVIDDGVEH